MKNKDKYIAIIIMLAVGLVVMALGVYNFMRVSDEKKTFIKVEGVITDIESHWTRINNNRRVERHTASVKFVTKEGDEITSSVGYPHKNSKNRVIEFYYHPADPKNIKLGFEPNKISIYMLIFGGIFFFGGILAFRSTRASEKKIAKLISTGKRVMADIYDIRQISYTTKANENVNLSTIYATHTENGKKYNFQSKETKFDLTPFLNSKVAVYIDYGDSSNYYVDVESLVDKKATINERVYLCSKQDT